MGREVRMVPADWEHPKSGQGNYTALFGGSYSKEAAKWDKAQRQWENGFREDWSAYPETAWKPIEGDIDCESYEDWAGERPEESNYMPDWPDAERTHLMMYETCSEGCPISPAFETPEELARWLADNGASAFGDMTATYDEWLATCKSGYAPSAVIEVGSDGGKMESGVAAMSK